MFKKIKRRIEKEIPSFLKKANRIYALKTLSPLLFKSIKEFSLRTGKRIRPTLFIIGYLGYAKNAPRGLYSSALSLELLHNFMLIHDDIIDKSDTRRGKPSLHKLLTSCLRNKGKVKIKGEDLAIVVGDIIYALGINALLSIREKRGRKEKALGQFTQAVVYTGGGEFIELIYSIKALSRINKRYIYKIYDYKTANYTFASPLVIGATLAGRDKKEINKLYQCGIYLGRAFQIKDDILGMFQEEEQIGKSPLTDLKEAKKTILIWYSYRNSNTKDKKRIEKLLAKEKANRKDLLIMRGLIRKTGALDYAKREIAKFLTKATKIILSSKMKTPYKITFGAYAKEILQISNIN